MTQTSAVMGTAQYLSPEQAQGQTVDARSDLYSTGCMLFELLTGRPPFQGDSPVAIAYQHVGQSPTPPSAFEPEVTAPMDAVVLHALNKDREARYPTAAEFRSDLQSVRLGRRVSDAALGTAAGVGTAATQTISSLGARPTEVYAAGSLSRAAAGGAGAAGAGTEVFDGGGRPAYGRDPFDHQTSSFPPVGREEEQHKRRGALWMMLTIATLLALGLIGWGAKSYFDNQAAANATVQVPDVVKQPQATAELRIRQVGLVPSVSQDKSDTVEQGSVISQSPDAQTSVAKGSTVKIVVSSGAAAIKVPDLKGKTEQEARQLLGDLKLTVGAVTEEDDSKVAKGKVISTSPAAGESVAPGSPVTLKVSSGKVTVPQLVGKTQDQAFTLLSEAGLTPKTTYQQTSAAPENTVLEQDQPVGTKVDTGSTINIVVAQATPPSPTPSVTPTPSSTPSSSSSPSASKSP
jgi:serine/threonine-protein kinase